MDETINGSSTGKLNELKFDFSLQDTEEEIIRLSKEIKRRKERRLQIVLGCIGLAFIVFIILIAPNLVNHQFGSYTFAATLAFFVTILVALFIAFLVIIIFQSTITSLESSIDELKAKQKVANLLDEDKSFHIYLDGGGTVNLAAPLESSSPENSAKSPSNSSLYFNKLVNINLLNLAGYYEQVKAQANKSFTASLIVGVIGVMFIILGLALGFAATANSQILTYISSGSGVITEFIAAVFFYLYNRTVRQMKGYHDSLLDVQNILLSLKLVEDTKEEAGKAKIVEKMVEYLVGGKHNSAHQPKEAGKG